MGVKGEERLVRVLQNEEWAEKRTGETHFGLTGIKKKLAGEQEEAESLSKGNPI